MPFTGPAPASTSEVSERVPPNPIVGRTVELSASDDPCPGSFGTEQPEPAVFKAIYHYMTRVGHSTAARPPRTLGRFRARPLSLVISIFEKSPSRTAKRPNDSGRQPSKTGREADDRHCRGDLITQPPATLDLQSEAANPIGITLPVFLDLDSQVQEHPPRIMLLQLPPCFGPDSLEGRAAGADDDSPL